MPLISLILLWLNHCCLLLGTAAPLALTDSSPGARKAGASPRVAQIAIDKGVPLWAMRFVRVLVGQRARTELRVVDFAGNQFKVLRVYASPVFALVVKLHALRYRPFQESVRDNVRVPRFPLVEESSMSLLAVNA